MYEVVEHMVCGFLYPLFACCSVIVRIAHNNTLRDAHQMYFIHFGAETMSHRCVQVG